MKLRIGMLAFALVLVLVGYSAAQPDITAAQYGGESATVPSIGTILSPHGCGDAMLDGNNAATLAWIDLAGLHTDLNYELRVLLLDRSDPRIYPWPLHQNISAIQQPGQSSFRFYLSQFFYNGNQALPGVGTGTEKEFLFSLRDGSSNLILNGFVRYLCDTGYVNNSAVYYP